MRLSEYLFQTKREFPKDSEIISDKYLGKANLLVKTASGLYMFSPMLWRTARKIMNIIREEMDAKGAQEVMLPVLQPSSLWKESGRWDEYLTAGVMFTLKDRKGETFGLGPTHEEVITDFARKTINSYRQLPVTIYQQHTKFRDELRPRFGLIRCREFIMKDAYSFDMDEQSQDASYNKMRDAYIRIFKRCGLDFRVVQADAGPIGGSGSEEFMVTADSGEDTIVTCPECGYSANMEKALSRTPEFSSIETGKPMEKLHTPNIRTVEELAEFTGLDRRQMVKTLIYKLTFRDREEFNAVLLRGDRDLNPTKLTNATSALAVELASEEDIQRLTQAKVGFAGPIGLNKDIRVIADESIRESMDFLCGGNQTDYHYVNVRFDRDTDMPETLDLAEAREDDPCAECGSGLTLSRGIEVGHIFKLGTRYSKALNACFLDPNGKEQPLIMGCYGIGSTRIISAAVEQNHDENGIIWPRQIAPFHFILIPAGKDLQKQKAEELYTAMKQRGMEVLLDDRKGSPGVKFKDADLVGIPFRIVVGRDVEKGTVEFQFRKSGEKKNIAIDSLIEFCESQLAGEETAS